MASRRLVPASVREALLGIPSDIASLERNYLLADDDLDLIGTRRRPENRLGLALHIALLRHPGQGWLDDTDPPTPLVAWLAEQIKVPFRALARYGSRGATRSNHRRRAIRHLGLRAFVPAHDMRTAMDVAARAAFDTDDGRIILARVSGAIQAQRFVLPSADTLERIGLAGRARARRLSAQAVNDALDDERKQALNALLAYDPSLGRSRLTWLRTPPQSTSAPSMLALLERLTYVRALALPRHLGDNIHPARRAQFAREGAVAPVNLLSDFGSRRRIASLAALMLELETTLTDAAIALFERLTGRLFTRSRNSQDRSWSASKTQAGRLIRLFGGAIDAMVRARRRGAVRARRTGGQTPPSSTPSYTMSIPAACPTTSSPCSTCSVSRSHRGCATFRTVGWRASADPGGGRNSPPSWASRSTRRSCSSIGTTLCG